MLMVHRFINSSQDLHKVSKKKKKDNFSHSADKITV